MRRKRSQRKAKSRKRRRIRSIKDENMRAAMRTKGKKLEEMIDTEGEIDTIRNIEEDTEEDRMVIIEMEENILLVVDKTFYNFF
jgi:hypothetical protein